MLVKVGAFLVCVLVWVAAGAHRVAAQDDAPPPGRWYHVEQTDPFDDRRRSMHAALYPDSVTGVRYLHDPVPLRVDCEDGKRLRINVLGPAPYVTDPSNVKSDYTIWSVRFSDGKIWKDKPASTQLSTDPGRGFVQAAFLEKEMTQHLVASQWVWIAYYTVLQEHLVAWYTLPTDTEAAIAKVYGYCNKRMPSRRANTPPQPASSPDTTPQVAGPSQ